MRAKLVGVAALVFMISLFTGPYVFAQQKVVQLRYSTYLPPSHPSAKITEEWGKEVEKRTQGRVKVRQYAGGTLVAGPLTYDSIIDSVIDVGNHVLSYTMGKFPLTEVLDYPLGIPNSKVGTRLINEYYAKFRPKEFDGVKVMYFHYSGPFVIHTTKPVAKLEDLQGLKLRTTGIAVKMISLLGGIPVAMPFSEAYDALSKGVIQGVVSNYETMETFKLAEVMKYTTDVHGCTGSPSLVVAMNKGKWNSISPQDQKTIEQINQEWIEKTGKVWDDLDISARQFSAKLGSKAIVLSAAETERWQAKVEPLFTDYVEGMKAKGLPGDEVVKFARNFIRKNK